MRALYLDYPVSNLFQDPASSFMYSIIDLHDRIIFYLLIVLAIVLWFALSSILNQKLHLAQINHGNTLELIWTITPALVLWAIGIPSLRLLY